MSPKIWFSGGRFRHVKYEDRRDFVEIHPLVDRAEERKVTSHLEKEGERETEDKTERACQLLGLE